MFHFVTNRCFLVFPAFDLSLRTDGLYFYLRWTAIELIVNVFPRLIPDYCIFPFTGPKITAVTVNNRFFTSQKLGCHGYIVDVCRCHLDGVNQTAVLVHTDMRLVAKVPCVAFFDLMCFRIPLFLFYPEIILDVVARELERDEFPGAEEVWRQDWQQKADPGRDRVFGVLVEGVLVTVARCRRTHGFLEVDSVFTIEEFRKRGYAREVLEQLVSSCGQEPLYLYSTLPMVALGAVWLAR